MSYYEPDYEDYGPSDELSQQIHQMIENEARAKIASTFTELEQARKTNEELRKQMHEMRNQIRTFDDRVKKERKAAEEELKRSFFDGYICGDKVFIAYSKYQRETCTTCSGTAKVTALIGNKEMEIKCPGCEGTGGKHSYEYEPHEDQIRTITVELNDRGGKFVQAYLKRKDTKVDYERIFTTLEECQAFCDQKNSEAKER